MITKKQIIEDFKSIRYYYSMKDVFDRNSDKVRPKTTEELVKKYSEIMENAPARLYVVYVGFSLLGYIDADGGIVVPVYSPKTSKTVHKHRDLPYAVPYYQPCRGNLIDIL